ncbi:Peptidase S13, D-Ala-D-Ala carboxypeptidase C [Fimbriimonadaceae bacterium]
MSPALTSLLYLATHQAPTATDQLEALLNDPKLKGALVSASITSLDGTTLYEKNPGQRVMPASNQKLISSAFALHQLGPDYRPRTRFWRVDDKVIIDSPGDPLMNYRTLIEASRLLRTNRSLRVFVRQSYNPGVPDTWEFDDLPNKYASPISAFTVDRASVELWNVNGTPAIRPTKYYLRIEQQEGPKLTTRYAPFERTIYINGKLEKKTERLDTLSLIAPSEAAMMLFGRPQRAIPELPEAPPTLAIDGRPLADMLKECLPPSDNNIAEHLLLLGAQAKTPLGDSPYSVARKSAQTFLEETVGVAKGDFRIYDGSGMSRHNLVTTRGITKLLTWAETQPTSRLYRNAMATPGRGTLATRLDGVPFQGKTGSLDMVVGLSGYLRCENGRQVAISIILNQFLCSATEARNILDDFTRSARRLQP